MLRCVLLLTALAGTAQAADCPPLAWEPAHPNDCRNTMTGATVLGVCCDKLLETVAFPIPTDAECVGVQHYSADCLTRSVRRGVRRVR